MAEIRLKTDRSQYFRAFSEVASERPHEIPCYFPVSRGIAVEDGSWWTALTASGTLKCRNKGRLGFLDTL
jgi:hypothetical protein